MPNPKQNLRQEMVARRDGLSVTDALNASRLIEEAIAASPWFTRAKSVLLYVPVRNEVSTLGLMSRLWERGVTVLLPRCSRERGKLSLGAVGSMEELAPGAYSIPEPPENACSPVESHSPDLILVPGVAYTRRGTRLGFGGGYYDRLLACPSMAKATIAAPAYAFQVVDAIPADDWDRPVNLIVTENETIEVRT